MPVIESIGFREPLVTTGELSTVGPSGTVDGNRLEMTANVRNPEGTPLEGKIEFEVTGIGGKVIFGRSEAVTLAPNAVTEARQTVDTTGWAWHPDGGPNPLVDVKVTLVVAAGASSNSAELPVRPKPLVLVHGLYSGPETWRAYFGPNNFPGIAHPTWRAWAVGDGQVPGQLNTDPLDKSSLTLAQDAAQVQMYVEGVRAATNASHVDMVSHSMGGVIARQYVHDHVVNAPDEKPVVSHLILMGVPNLGSPCADQLSVILGNVGRLTAPAWELRGLSMESFNTNVSNRKGVAFSTLVGDSYPNTCLDPDMRGDLYVGLESARWDVADTETHKMVHTDMPKSPEAFGFIEKRVIVPAKPVIEQTGYIDVLSTRRPSLGASSLGVPSRPPIARASAKKKAGSCPAAVRPIEIKTSDFKQLKASGKAKIAIPVSAAKRLDVLLTAPYSVGAELRDPAGKVRASSAADPSLVGGGSRTLSVASPRAGTWQLQVTQTAAEPTAVVVGTTTTGGKEKLIAKATRTKKDELIVIAKASASKRPVRGLQVTGKVLAFGLKTQKLTLRDDGRTGDRKAGDGAYAGRLKKAPKQSVMIAVTARGKSFASSSVVSLCAK